MPGLANMEPKSHIKDEDGNGPDAFLIDDEVDEDVTSFKSRTPLPQPGSFLRTLDYLMNALETGNLDVDPEYQREVVWTADRMTGLVNSLMENFYIPPIILNKKPRDSQDGASPRNTLVCVDGKQRLSSVRAFIKGMIPCTDHCGEKWWYCASLDTVGGRRKKVLPEKDKKAFINKELVSFEYAGLTQEQEEDLFARVQMGVQLTLAEKMRASSGKWQELGRCFVDDYPAIYSLLKDRARAKDFQITLSCFSQIIEVQHPSAANGIPVLKTNYTHLPKLLANARAVDDGQKSHLASVWNTFQDLLDLDPNTFTNADRRLRGVQTFAPIEMVAVTVLISMYSDSRSNQLLIGDIRALRDALREHFSELRLNTPTWKFIWDFIDKLEQIRGAVDGSTVDRSAGAETASSRGMPVAPAMPLSSKGRLLGRTSTTAVTPSTAKIKPESEEAAPLSVDHRPRKRSRVDDSSAVVTTSGAALQHSEGTIRASRIASSPTEPQDTGNLFLNTVSASSSTSTKHFLPAISTPVSQASCPEMETHGSQNSILQRTSLLSYPGDARHNRTSEFDGYRAPTVPMMSGNSIGDQFKASAQPFDGRSWTLPNRSISPATNGRATHSKPVPASIRTDFSSANNRINTNASVLAPLASGPMRPPLPPSNEALHNVSPTIPSAQARPMPHPKSKPKPKPRPRISPRSLPQYDGAIDLTSEDEQDGQELLALFGATASVGKSTATGKTSTQSGSGRLSRPPVSRLTTR